MNNNIKISGKILPRYNEILSEAALEFVQEIHEKFNNSNWWSWICRLWPY